MVFIPDKSTAHTAPSFLDFLHAHSLSPLSPPVLHHAELLHARSEIPCLPELLIAFHHSLPAQNELPSVLPVRGRQACGQLQVEDGERGVAALGREALQRLAIYGAVGGAMHWDRR
jgi:hypothetical protein